jgi:hypothetical protein
MNILSFYLFMLKHGYECILYYLLFYVSNMTDSISNRSVGPCMDWWKANKELIKNEWIRIGTKQKEDSAPSIWN